MVNKNEQNSPKTSPKTARAGEISELPENIINTKLKGDYRPLY